MATTPLPLTTPVSRNCSENDLRQSDDSEGSSFSSRSPAVVVKKTNAPAAVLLRETVAWGAVAECGIMVCCPSRMFGRVDMTATTLNIICPLLGGVVQALDDIAGANNPQLRCRCSAFQSGFIGVSTSFSFMAEQAARLGAADGCTYIVVTMASSWFIFATGRAAFAAALRGSPLRSFAYRLRAGRAAPSLSRVLYSLIAFVAVLWVWVLLTPAGAVFDPNAFEASGWSPASVSAAAAADAAMDAAHDASVVATASPRPDASKADDMLHLATGLGMQGLGLALSAYVGACPCVAASVASSQPLLGDGSGDGSKVRRLAGGIHWPALFCNVLACGLLCALRMGEALAGYSADAPPLLALKLRTSGCGALSVLGGLAGLLTTERVTPARREYGRAARITVNFVLHVYVASVTCVLLPRLTAWAAR